MNNVIAVVMGRNYNSRLGMIRAVGQMGCSVVVVKTDPNEKKASKKCKIDASSKYVTKYFCLKEPDEDALVKLLLCEFAEELKKVILLPTDDYTASVIDTHQDVLRDYFLYPNICEKNGEVLRYMDKGIQKQLAQDINIPIAKGWTADFVDDKYIIPEDIEYPCFIKPQLSIKGVKRFMQKCNSRAELESAFLNVPKRGQCSILIEQYINIEKEYAILGYCNKDEIIIPAVIQVEKNFFGVTATGKVIPIEEFGTLKSDLVKYMKRLQFTGLFDVDLYESNGKVYFNELNLRFGASGYAITAAGINLPEMLVNTLTGNKEKNVIIKEQIVSKRFANEKVCLQKYASKEIGLREFWKCINDTDITFVKNKIDKAPYIHYIYNVMLTVCFRWLKKALKIFKKCI